MKIDKRLLPDGIKIKGEFVNTGKVFIGNKEFSDEPQGAELKKEEKSGN